MKRTSTLPYFQLDSGKVLLDCMGLSWEERGMFLTLMAVYWEGECSLPTKDALKRKLSIKGAKAGALLDRVLEDSFPDGLHEGLDLCKANALQTSRTNSANAQKGHAQRRQVTGISQVAQSSKSDPDDF